MKKLVNFCKSYWFEILFVCAVIAAMVLLKGEMRMYFILFIITFSILSFSLYFSVVLGMNMGFSEKEYSKEKAIKRFVQAHNCTPDEKGFSVIEFIDSHNLFIYAISKEVINAYKVQQRIMSWMWKWYLPIWLFVIGMWIAIFISFKDALHPICITTYLFMGFWIILYRRLNNRFYETISHIICGKTVEFLCNCSD